MFNYNVTALQRMVCFLYILLETFHSISSSVCANQNIGCYESSRSVFISDLVKFSQVYLVKNGSLSLNKNSLN